MNYCEICKIEISTHATFCKECMRERKNRKRRERDQAYRDLGLKKVRGALGGIYWE